MIPFLDIASEYRELRAEIDAAVARVLTASQFVLGPEVEAFENEFAQYCGAAYAVGVNSGTSALHLALLALGIGPGDEVITAPFTFYASVAAIQYAGATPVLADIDPCTFNLDPAQVRACISSRTRAILPVHLYGQPAAMDDILAIAQRYALAVIEDAAQAHGAEHAGRRVGTLGDVGCFSFYPTKNLGAAGEGGIAVTNDEGIARKLRRLRDWGQERRYYPVLRGFNYRMEAIQAAVLRVKLPKLASWIEARRANAAIYDRLLAGAAVDLPRQRPGSHHVYHLYTIRAEERGRLQEALAEQDIQTAVHYPAPIHLLPAYADPRYREGSFPAAEACAQTVLSLPVHPFLTATQIEKVCAAIHSFNQA